MTFTMTTTERNNIPGKLLRFSSLQSSKNCSFKKYQYTTKIETVWKSVYANLPLAWLSHKTISNRKHSISIRHWIVSVFGLTSLESIVVRIYLKRGLLHDCRTAPAHAVDQKENVPPLLIQWVEGVKRGIQLYADIVIWMLLRGPFEMKYHKRWYANCGTFKTMTKPTRISGCGGISI